jgi:hypothetical protein
MATTIQTSKQSIVIPPDANGNSQSNIAEMVYDLDKRRSNITKKYNDKLLFLQNEYYNHQNDDTKLKQFLDNEIANQIQTDSIYFNQYQTKQNNKINSLLSQVNELQTIERKLYGDDMKYASIKSFKGKTLTLTSVNKDYLINVNNNCLHLGDNDQLKLKICNPNSVGQKFNIVTVYDINTFFSIFNIMPKQEEIDQFPFNVVVSKANNKLCLMDNNEQGVSVNKCSSLDGQKWIGLKSTEKCTS